MAKKQREPPNDPVLSLDGKNGTALSEEPVLVTGEEMNADDLLNCTLESLQTLTDFGLRSLIEHSRHLQAMATIELKRRKSEGQNI
jgi:hypothetical protein